MSDPQSHPVGTLFDLIEGPIRFHLVDWAFRVGIFDACASATRPETVAEAKGLDPPRIGIALRALTALGLLQQSDGAFQVTPVAAAYLLAGSDRCLAATFASLAETRHRALDRLDAVFAAAVDRLDHPLDERHWHRAQTALQAFHAAIAVDHMLPCLTALAEWPGATRFLDVGAGSAVLAEQIAVAKPEACVTVFDLPRTIRQIEAQGTGAKAPQLAPGDYTDPATLPEGPFDVIWASMSLYFHGSSLAAVLSNLAKRLAPGGVFLSFHEDLQGGRTAPQEHVVGRLMPALLGQDVSFADGDMAAAMAAAGLTGLTSEYRQTPFGCYRLDAGRAR
ncbi:MAG: class I SAM-dependent methyltransferase [Pseudomonadota bacterium]